MIEEVSRQWRAAFCALLLIAISNSAGANSDLKTRWQALISAFEQGGEEYLEPPPCDTTFAESEDMAQATAEALEAKGWEVTKGNMIFTRGHMFGNNPESVYGLFVGLNIEDVPLFAMGDTDAILWAGCTPPSLEYFSIRSYLFGVANDKHFLTNATDVFGSLGDSANNMRCVSPRPNQRSTFS